MDNTFSIQFVSQMTGINGHTIRAWEKRYSAVIPKRDKNQRRLYTQADIDRLKRIHDLCTLGNSVSDIASLGDNRLEELHRKYFSEKVTVDRETREESSELEPLDVNLTLQNLMLAISHYKLDIISHELEKAQKSLKAREFALNLVVPLLMEIGMHVNNGYITVGMEHAITAIVRFHLGQMIFNEYQKKRKVNFQIVLATPEKEFDDISIMIASLLCAHYNFKFTYLGVNMTPYVLADTSKQIKADLVLLSVSRGFILNQQGNFQKYLDNLVKKSDPKMRIWVTGVNQREVKKGPVDFIPSLQILDHRLSELL